MLSWREIQKEAFTSVKELAAFLELDNNQKERLIENSPFALNLPLRLANKIKKGSLDDPILRQFVPLDLEDSSNPSYSPDPLQEKEFKKSGKLLIKYKSRALLLTTSACAMHCRFCFRRQFPYEKSFAGFDKEIEMIKTDDSLEEIILSGGDPLSLSDQTLEMLLDAFEQISHIKRIRFHTRFPIGIPERISEEFLAILAKCSKQIFFVVHVNHFEELDIDVLQGLKKVLKLGIPVLTQSVLLKGVNDSSEVLKKLFALLVDHGIIPYYLHSLDEVQGASHFEVPIEEGHLLIKELTSQLSGYAIPKFVKELPGEPSKVVL